MSRSAWIIAAVVLIVALLALGSAVGWFSAVEAPGPAPIAPEAGGTTQ